MLIPCRGRRPCAQRPTTRARNASARSRSATSSQDQRARGSTTIRHERDRRLLAEPRIDLALGINLRPSLRQVSQKALAKLRQKAELLGERSRLGPLAGGAIDVRVHIKESVRRHEPRGVIRAARRLAPSLLHDADHDEEHRHQQSGERDPPERCANGAAQSEAVSCRSRVRGSASRRSSLRCRRPSFASVADGRRSRSRGGLPRGDSGFEAGSRRRRRSPALSGADRSRGAGTAAVRVSTCVA